MLNTEFVAIVQARRGSSRFPDKVLKNIFNRPMVFHVIKRVQQAESISKVVMATTTSPKDKILAQIAEAARAEIFFGNRDDVLDRYYQAASLFKAANVVRVTADCPVIDPAIIDTVVARFHKSKYDYVSNAASYPEGLGIEVFTFGALEKAWKEARLASEREHVTPYIWKNPKLFRILKIKNSSHSPHLRLTVDYRKDLSLITKIYRYLFPANPFFGYREILLLVKRYPQLIEINRGIPRLEGYKKSLREDKMV